MINKIQEIFNIPELKRKGITETFIRALRDNIRENTMRK